MNARLAFLVPFGSVGSPHSSEEGFQMAREPENKTPKSDLPAGQLLDPSLGSGGRRLQHGLKLRRISFYPPFSYHKAKESIGGGMIAYRALSRHP